MAETATKDATITTIEDIRRPVMDDAMDLISAIGIADPLVSSGRFEKFGPDRRQVAYFLRKLLTRNVILIVARLHERHGRGKTGDTASIEALLEFSRGRLPDEKIQEFKSKRIDLLRALESKGIKYNDIYDLRTSKVAHSIHPTTPLADNLYYSSILELAHDTYELVLEIDKALVASGLPEFWKLADEFHLWLDRGRAFWPELHDED